MKRLYLTVEGQTEAQFANAVLRPHLLAHQVFLHAPRFTGLHARRGGRVPRGGLLTAFRYTLADLKRWLKEDSGPDARFSMMVDLYALPHDFPGYADGMKRTTGRAKAESLEAALGAEIRDQRFVPYIQVHEFEALVLADPQILSRMYELSQSALDRLGRECSAFASPEEINLGQHSHPKYPIKQIIPTYDENVAGPLLTEEIGLPTLRARCPHFGDWLTRLERLDLI